MDATPCGSLAVLSTLLVVFLVGSSPGAAANRGPAKIVLVSKTTSERVTDKAPNGPSAGDRSQQTSRLFNEVPQFGKPAGSLVGRDEATFVLVSKTSGTLTGVTYLPGGTLIVQGRLKTDLKRGGIVAPVTRGTGRFRGARGMVWIVRVPNPVRDLNVYTLKYSAG